MNTATAVKEKPMLFSGPMVRAILDGRKTQTRRVVKPQPDCEVQHRPYWHVGGWRLVDGAPTQIKCPHPAGSFAWVKETWRPQTSHSHGIGECDCGDVEITYAADEATRFFSDYDLNHGLNAQDWVMPKAAARGNVSPFFLPRWASRITLEITDVRVQRLHYISQHDAASEGVTYGTIDGRTVTPLDAFIELWNSINGPRAWEQNPWVWAYTFKVLTL